MASEQKTAEALVLLSTSCLSTSDTAAFLVGHFRLWDVEILMRSVLEGTYKFIAMCIRNDTDRLLRVEEYWDHLPEIGRIKTHKKAEMFLRTVTDPASDAWRPIRDLMLPPEELNQLLDRYPRKIPDNLEKRWSFGELSKALAESDLPAAKYLVIMLHNYRLSSHLVHQDGDGVLMIWERDQRSPPRKEALEIAHGLRELSDIFYLSMFRALAAYQFAGMDRSPILAMNTKYSALLSRVEEAGRLWHKVEYGADVA
ncbi:MAG TPA: hypothetical protein VGQ28_01795 [Thermoanaerobaculia bacterium]|nr:hypothetical protein [Thermoanaerobaculia bacterium]